MATLETRQTPDGKTSYRVKICIRGFPSQSATFERKTDARQLGAYALADVTKTLIIEKRDKLIASSFYWC